MKAPRDCSKNIFLKMMISNFPPPFPLPPCFCMINYKISKMDQENFQKKFIQNIKFYMHMIGIKAQSPNEQPFKKTSLIHIRDPVQKFSTHSQFALGRRCGEDDFTSKTNHIFSRSIHEIFFFFFFSFFKTKFCFCLGEAARYL